MGKTKTYAVCESCDKPILEAVVEVNEIADSTGKVLAKSGSYHRGCLVKALGHKCKEALLVEYVRQQRRWPYIEPTPVWKLKDYSTLGPGDCGGIGPPVRLMGVGWNADAGGLLKAGDGCSD